MHESESSLVEKPIATCTTGTNISICDSQSESSDIDIAEVSESPPSTQTVSNPNLQQNQKLGMLAKKLQGELDSKTEQMAELDMQLQHLQHFSGRVATPMVSAVENQCCSY